MAATPNFTLRKTTSLFQGLILHVLNLFVSDDRGKAPGDPNWKEYDMQKSPVK